MERFRAFLVPADEESPARIHLHSTDPVPVLLEVMRVVQATEEHRSLILATWLKSYNRQGLQVSGSSGLHLRMTETTYKHGEKLVAEKYWQASKCLMSKDDDYTVHAWVCGGDSRLFHVYVPPALRGSGVATSLIEHTCGKKYVTHKPFKVPTGHTVTYNPYIQGL